MQLPWIQPKDKITLDHYHHLQKTIYNASSYQAHLGCSLCTGKVMAAH